jgi:hypothetical protein
MAANTGTEPIWSKTKPASFEIDGRPKVLFPVWNNLEGSHGIRVVKRQVPFVDGEQLDETGCTAKEWTTDIPFFNDLVDSEPGIGASPVLYPDRLELLESIFELRKTGTLHLPWRRNIRCKAVTWRRVATTDRFDGETLAVLWCQDNENKLDNPSAGAGLKVSLNFEVKQAIFEAESEGMWNGSWEQLTTLASQLEAAMNAPAEFRADIAHKANRVVRCCETILNAFTSNVPGMDGMNKPSGGRAHTRIRRIRDAASRAEEESREGRPRVRTRRAPITGSLWEISRLRGWMYDPYDLLNLNPLIPDPNEIEIGSPILVPVV